MPCFQVQSTQTLKKKGVCLAKMPMRKIPLITLEHVFLSKQIYFSVLWHEKTKPSYSLSQ